MKIYKFGGASVASAASIKNVANIIATDSSKLLVVISAMGKTTNALEEIVDAIFYKKETLNNSIVALKNSHLTIVNELELTNPFSLENEIENIFIEIECIAELGFDGKEYDFIYDQIISFGELLSTKIVSYYLLEIGIKNQWIDARNFILTTNRYRDARIRWQDTENIIANRLQNLATKSLIITQGFIGRGPMGETTTLGREGSDYSAAIFAYCLKAEGLYIWKDVAGLMNADPKKFEEATLIPAISYEDTIELAYYGASVIHPKTMQPLQSKHIPLYVKSFLNPLQPGTMVYNDAPVLDVACFIHKNKQAILKCQTTDFTFIVEDQLSQILLILANNKLKVSLMQNSALSFTVAIDFRDSISIAAKELEQLGYKISVFLDLQLLTVYNSTQKHAMLQNTTILMEQITPRASHYVFK